MSWKGKLKGNDLGKRLGETFFRKKSLPQTPFKKTNFGDNVYKPPTYQRLSNNFTNNKNPVPSRREGTFTID
jgi:hypothetical protein